MVLSAVCQMNSGGNVSLNASVAVGLISRASRAGAKAVFLPEASDFIAPATAVPTLARSPDNRQFFRGVREAARDHKVFVSVGIHEPLIAGWPDRLLDQVGQEEQEAQEAKQRCYNTQLLFGPGGEELQRYRKLHLFDVDIAGGLTILESNTTAPGERLPSVVPSPIGAVGPLTCYDLRFPESSLYLRRKGAEVLTYPSAFTVRTGAAHWELLLRARAVETQCYVLAAAQVGTFVKVFASYFGRREYVSENTQSKAAAVGRKRGKSRRCTR